MLVDQISKISTITGNILKYSRKSKLEKEKIDLVKIVNECTTVYRPLLKDKDITLLTKFEIKTAMITRNNFV